MALNTLVLLPGLDGSGRLFADFLSALPPSLRTIIASYPTHRFLSYSELLPCVGDVIPSAEPFVLLAESFSSPLAVMFAARHPANLAGLVVCAGFVTNPIRTWSLSFLARLLSRPLLFRLPPSEFMLERFLIGADAPVALRVDVCQTLRCVGPSVLARRVHAVLDCDARRDLTRVDVPMLYIQAANDRLVRAESFAEIQRLHSDTILASISAPHLVLQREPHKAAETIVGFIQRLASDKGSQPNR